LDVAVIKAALVAPLVATDFMLKINLAFGALFLAAVALIDIMVSAFWLDLLLLASVFHLLRCFTCFLFVRAILPQDMHAVKTEQQSGLRFVELCYAFGIGTS